MISKREPPFRKPTKKKLSKSAQLAVQRAIDYFGEYDTDLARALGVYYTLVGRWRAGKQHVSLRCALLIEKKTKGTVKATDLVDSLK